MTAWEDLRGAALLVPPQKLLRRVRTWSSDPPAWTTRVFTSVVKPQARTCLLTLFKCQLKCTSGRSAVGLNRVHVAVHARVRERGGQ